MRWHYHYDTPQRRDALYASKGARLAKVVYLFLYAFALVLCAIFALMLLRAGFSLILAFVAVAIVVGFFEAVRRAFYYIQSGSAFPKK